MGKLVDYNLARLKHLIAIAKEEKSKTSERYFRKILDNYEQGRIDIHWINGRLRVEKKVDPPEGECAKTND